MWEFLFFPFVSLSLFPVFMRMLHKPRFEIKPKDPKISCAHEAEAVIDDRESFVITFGLQKKRATLVVIYDPVSCASSKLLTLMFPSPMCDNIKRTKAIVFLIFMRKTCLARNSPAPHSPQIRKTYATDMLKRLWERSFKAIKMLFNYKSFRHKCSHFYCPAHARVYCSFPTFPHQRPLCNLSLYLHCNSFWFFCVYFWTFQLVNNSYDTSSDVNGPIMPIDRTIGSTTHGAEKSREKDL